MKQQSAFFSMQLIQRARDNRTSLSWAGAAVHASINAAQPWLDMSDDTLWALVFGPALPRSWMVWSHGFCPACRTSVPMYDWQIDALRHPWKVACPHCAMHFPTNDFMAFHRSGLDAAGVFDPALADRNLLFHAAHPDPDDPLHTFGVDDGDGYTDGEHRWRFIGAYLIYGQWKQVILGGIRCLTAAWLHTGDPRYARKAAILLDRVADLYPTFDFQAQAYTYEQHLGAGYVSVWHDACLETRELALAYDLIYEALRDDDATLVDFLAEKAHRHGTARQTQKLPAPISDEISRIASCATRWPTGRIKSAQMSHRPISPALLSKRCWAGRRTVKQYWACWTRSLREQQRRMA